MYSVHFVMEPYAISGSLGGGIQNKGEVVPFKQNRNSTNRKRDFVLEKPSVQAETFQKRLNRRKREGGSHLWKLGTAHRLYLSVRAEPVLSGTWQQLLLTAT